jgi:hypothetical protein
MAITNPRIHIICGMCGCSKEFSYEIKDVYDEDMKPIKVVYVYCDNCGSLTELSEIIKEK